jgi:hypothetical protein
LIGLFAAISMQPCQAASERIMSRTASGSGSLADGVEFDWADMRAVNIGESFGRTRE